MSLGGALSTAGLGLTAMAQAIGSISENIANAQTVGYKVVGTNFSTLLNVSGAEVSGGVSASTALSATTQGSVQNTGVDTNIAVQGAGYFSVSNATGRNGATTIFAPQPLYSRAGDFTLNKDGFMVNGSGFFLNGYPITAAGTANRNLLQPIQVVSRTINPSLTQNITYAANLPAQGSGPLTQNQVTFIDQQGNTHTLNVQWTANGGNDFSVQLATPGGSTDKALGLAVVNPPTGVDMQTYIQQANASGVAVAALGAAGTPPAPANADFQFKADGSLQAIAAGGGGAGLGAGTVVNGGTGAKGTAGAAGATVGTAGNQAAVVLTVSLANGGTQNVLLNFGKYSTQGTLTAYTGTDINFAGQQQDGTGAGNFTGLTVNTQGVVTASYDNGAKKSLFQVPVALFPNFNGLQPQNGNAFLESVDSGQASLQLPGSNSAGKIIGAAIENSTADIAQEFSKLIQTQNAYTANTRVVTVSNQMFQQLNQVVQ